MNKQEEYKTLREEILQGKKYVFERPLLIITISVALIKFIDKPYIYFIPMLMLSLLLFNLWFTVNRLRSIARIVSYIQLILENDDKESNGWESSLRYYRKWVKSHKNRLKEILERDMDKDAIPDAMGYYPVIYYFHFGVVVFVFVSSVVYTIMHPSILQLITMFLTLLLIVFFIFYSITCHPRKTGNFIEENRIIWKHVFKVMEQSKIPKGTENNLVK